MKKFWLPVAISAFVFGACDRNKVFEDTADLSNAYWLADSVKTFTFEIADPGSTYNIFFNLRNSLEYPHSNIYVHYAILDSTNTVLDEELRNFQLFHPKSGYPFGNGAGNIYQHQFDLLYGYQFPAAGVYKISLEQYMRYDSLPEVYSVGVRIATPE